MSLARSDFLLSIEAFLRDSSEAHFAQIKKAISAAQSSQEANGMFCDLQIKRTEFAARHFKQMETRNGIMTGGGIGLVAGSAYEGIVNGVTPTLTTGYFGGVGAAAGVIYKFFSSEMQNRKTKHYPTFLKLIELERLAGAKELEFASSADSKETNASGLKRRR